MPHFLEWVYNWSFAAGTVIGFLVMRVYSRLVEHRNGAPHTHMSRIAVAGVITVAVVGYVLLTAQRAQDQALHIARVQVNCQNDLNRVIKERSFYTDRTNTLNKHRQDLLDQLNEAAVDWLNQLLNPPPEIAGLVINDPRRQEYGLVVSREYFLHASKIRDQIAAVRIQQDDLSKELATHPIPALCNTPV